MIREILEGQHKIDKKMLSNNKRTSIQFEIDIKVFLNIALMRVVMRFGKKSKLSPRYRGSYEIPDKIGNVARRLALPPKLEKNYNVVHVLILRKYILNHSHV